jgi:hypothetical protein
MAHNLTGASMSQMTPNSVCQSQALKISKGMHGCAALYCCAGTGQNMFGLNWGNGFITNQDIIGSRGLSDPNDFFQDMLRKPYVSSVSPFAAPDQRIMVPSGPACSAPREALTLLFNMYACAKSTAQCAAATARAVDGVSVIC